MQILHVAVRDLESAEQLLKIAVDCGFRESGISGTRLGEDQSRFRAMVGIRTNIRLDVPIGHISQDVATVSASNEYLRYLCKLANDERMVANKRRLDRLYASIESYLLKFQSQMESKEDRKIRKRAEGLLRQQEMKRIEEKCIKENKEVDMYEILL